MNCSGLGPPKSANHDPETAPHPRRVRQPGMGAGHPIAVLPHLGHGVEVTGLEGVVERLVGRPHRRLIGRVVRMVVVVGGVSHRVDAIRLGWGAQARMQRCASCRPPTASRSRSHEHGGSGRPTLFCHATGLHGAVWEPLAAALGDGFERWAVDFRAHGASTIPAGNPLPWDDIASDVTTVVDGPRCPARAAARRRALHGWCLPAARRASPTRARSPGSGCSSPSRRRSGRSRDLTGDNRLADGALRRRPSFPSIADAIANYASKPPFNTSRADALYAYVRHGFVAGEDGAVHLACRPADESQVFRSGGGHRAFDHLGEVHCPVVVACSEEVVGPAAFAPAVAAALPARPPRAPPSHEPLRTVGGPDRAGRGHPGVRGRPLNKPHPETDVTTLALVHKWREPDDHRVGELRGARARRCC